MSKPFTTPQRQAIESDAKDIAVIAGPGSGKTTVLCERITRLLNEGAKACDMVIITFTNAAAREIEKRLAIHERGQRFAYAGTLHGYILRLLREVGKLINLPKRISMLGEDESKSLVIQIMSDQNVKLPQADVRAALQHGPEFYLFEKPERLSKQQCVASAYYRQLMEAGVMDFDSLLKFGLCLLHRAQPTIPYLFWDEVQDGGAEDWDILECLQKQCARSFIVGDPDQSIYGFRGARPDLFLTYMREHPGCEVIVLEENFRCLGEICKAASALIAHNGSVKRTVPCERPTREDGVIERWSGFDDAGELFALVQDLRTQPTPMECAVLVRTNALAEKISKALEGYALPVAKKEIRDRPLDWSRTRALIALLENPYNDLLCYWWIVREQGMVAANGAKLMAMRARRPLCEYLNALPRAADLLTLPLHLADQRCGPESIELVKKAMATLPDGSSLAELAYALSDEELHRKESGEGITITTMHSAKGREWDCVYLPAFEQSIIPKKTSTSDLMEERRLAFVAFTRARRLLVVSNAYSRAPQFGKGRPQPADPSQFIEEAGLSITGE